MLFHPYVNAYRKDHATYTYYQDDGLRVTLTAGEDGVTEAWIARLKAFHREERSLLRRGEGLTVPLNDLVLRAPSQGEPEQVLLRKEEKKRLLSALSAIRPDQAALLMRASREPVSAIARDLGRSESSVRERLTRIKKNLQKLLAAPPESPHLAG